MKLSFQTQLEHIQSVQSDCLQATFDYFNTFMNTSRGLSFIMRQNPLQHEEETRK